MKMHKQDETGISVIFAESHVGDVVSRAVVALPKERWAEMGSPERLDVIVRPQKETPIAVASVVKKAES